MILEDGGLDGNLSTPGDNASYQESFTVTVNNVNDLPSISVIGDQVIPGAISLDTIRELIAEARQS